MAQWIRRLTTDQAILGSSPGAVGESVPFFKKPNKSEQMLVISPCKRVLLGLGSFSCVTPRPAKSPVSQLTAVQYGTCTKCPFVLLWPRRLGCSVRIESNMVQWSGCTHSGCILPSSPIRTMLGPISNMQLHLIFSTQKPLL